MACNIPAGEHSKMYKYLPKQKFYLSIDQLKHRNENEENMTLHQVEFERKMGLYVPNDKPLSECVKLPPLAAIGPAVSGRLPDEGYTEKTKWLTSPIPGLRTQQELDPNRKRGLKDKNSLIYRKNSGLIPKYSGYVPGERFRYGKTYGHLTFNAKEIGHIGSKTWGGAVSINIGNQST